MDSKVKVSEGAIQTDLAVKYTEPPRDARQYSCQAPPGKER